jgi:hypothetical protein
MITLRFMNGRISLNKAKLDFWVDLAIALAGAISAMSGLLLLWPAGLTTGILSISFRAWSSLHTWSSLAAVAGVGLHLALHRNWTIAMTKRMLLSVPQRQVVAPASGSGYAQAQGGPISRRAFLAIGGVVAVATGLAAAGYKATANAASVEDGQEVSTTAGTGQGSGVACPFGLVNDPSPGQCHHFVDSDGDGYRKGPLDYPFNLEPVLIHV